MKKHLIIITKGREDGGKAATNGAELAVTFQAMNHEVSVFLTLGGTHWAYKETGMDVHVPGHMCLEDYFSAFTSNGGELMVCAPCVASYCHLPMLTDEELSRGLREGAQYVGLATVANRLISCNATVF